MSADTKIYRMTPEGLDRMAQRIGQGSHLRFGFILLCFAGLVFWRSDRSSFTLILDIAVAAAAASLIAYVYPKGIAEKTRKAYESFAIHLGSDSLLRKQDGYRDLTIRREDVRGVIENFNGWLLIRSADPHFALYVPPEIEGFDELRSVLTQWAGPVSATAERLYQILLAGGGCISVFAHFGKEWIANPWLRPLAHLASAVALVWSFLDFRRSPHVDERSRKYGWLILVWALVELYFAFELLLHLLRS